MSIRRNINFFTYAEHAQKLLAREGVCFRQDGFPDLTQFEYVQTIPRDIEVWPYNKRNQAVNPRKTILTFFEADPLLYGYINTLDKVASNLALYWGVTGFDLSPCLDASCEEQKAALLLNGLTNGLFLSHGIRVIPTLRTGCVETITALESYPRNVCYAFGALGCRQKFKSIGQTILSLKIALREPSQILSYGTLSDCDRQVFSRWNIPVLSVSDYQTKSRRKTYERILQNV